MGLINTLLAINWLNKVPVDESVENNKRSNRKYYVADRSQPQHVDVQIPGFLHDITNIANSVSTTLIATYWAADNNDWELRRTAA